MCIYWLWNIKNVNGYFSVKKMYSKAKSCVKVCKYYSVYFTNLYLVRQGKDISLFVLFLNDLNSSLLENLYCIEWSYFCKNDWWGCRKPISNVYTFGCLWHCNMFWIWKKYKNHSILCQYIVPSGIYLSVNVKKTCTNVPFEMNFTTF